MTAQALWPFALEIYARPGVEPLLLTLQDDHGQCVAFLIWALWAAAQGRVLDGAALATAAELARAWQDAAVAPLRGLRRSLKLRAFVAPPAGARERLREGVKSLELDAERMLLQMLDAASPPPAARGQADPLTTLENAAAAWGGNAPPELLAKLALGTA
ncbi:MAG: TIGR02444 family protein [Caulobacterales bacterium]